MLKKKKKKLEKKTKSKSDFFLQSIQRKNPRGCEGFLSMDDICTQRLGFATPFGGSATEAEQSEYRQRGWFGNWVVVLGLKRKCDIEIRSADHIV